MFLDQIAPGEWARIIRVTGAEKLRRRLTALGFTAGTWVTGEQPAPGGDPAVCSLRGYTVAMRRAHARQIEVEKE